MYGRGGGQMDEGKHECESVFLLNEHIFIRLFLPLLKKKHEYGSWHSPESARRSEVSQPMIFLLLSIYWLVSEKQASKTKIKGNIQSNVVTITLQTQHTFHVAIRFAPIVAACWKTQL